MQTGHPEEGSTIVPVDGQDNTGRDLYLATLDPTVPGLYESWGDPRYTLSFVGTVRDSAARVQQTANIVPFTLDEAFEQKHRELENYTEVVSTSAFEHDVGQLTFWALATQPARNARSSYDGYLSTRVADQLTAAIDAGIAGGAGNTNAEVSAFWAQLKTMTLSGNGQLYWERDIKVVLFDRVTLKQVRDNANQNQWSGLAESQGTFDWQWRSANDRVWADMVTAYDDNDQQQLELIDVRAPSYNWPPHYTGAWTPGRITIVEMRNR
jgi:hypothetical protein